jgi:hypothetical protein
MTTSAPSYSKAEYTGENEWVTPLSCINPGLTLELVPAIGHKPVRLSEHGSCHEISSLRIPLRAKIGRHNDIRGLFGA